MKPLQFCTGFIFRTFRAIMTGKIEIPQVFFFLNQSLLAHSVKYL